MYVPAGFYLLSKPLTCTNAALTMMGDGSSSSVLVIRHAETALAVTCEAMSQCVTIHDIGFTPVPGGSGTAGAAIAIVHPNQPSGWPGCVIEDVDLGVPYPGYTVFDSGLELENLWRGHIRNVNRHSNIGSVSRTRFAVLGGTCIDNIFTGCTVDGVGTAFTLRAYSEGLHIRDCVVIGEAGLSTGSIAYSGNGMTAPFINLLGLYISGSEFNTRSSSLDLYLVDTGWISDSHFSTHTSSDAAVQITGSTLLHINACSMTGQFNPLSAASFTGVANGHDYGRSEHDLRIDRRLRLHQPVLRYRLRPGNQQFDSDRCQDACAWQHHAGEWISDRQWFGRRDIDGHQRQHHEHLHQCRKHHDPIRRRHQVYLQQTLKREPAYQAHRLYL